MKPRYKKKDTLKELTLRVGSTAYALKYNEELLKIEETTASQDVMSIIDKAFPFCIPPLKDKSVLVAVHHVL